MALLFTDIVMPGMNGWKLADQALLARPGLKLLFTTGRARKAGVQGARCVLDSQAWTPSYWRAEP